MTERHCETDLLPALHLQVFDPLFVAGQPVDALQTVAVRGDVVGVYAEEHGVLEEHLSVGRHVEARVKKKKPRAGTCQEEESRVQARGKVVHASRNGEGRQRKNREREDREEERGKQENREERGKTKREERREGRRRQRRRRRRREFSREREERTASGNVGCSLRSI